MSKWISVDDELPDYYKDVYVFTEIGTIDIGFLHLTSCGLLEWLGSYGRKVTHWQEIDYPEPPEI